MEIIKSHCSGVRIIKFGEGGEESQGGEVQELVNKRGERFQSISGKDNKTRRS